MRADKVGLKVFLVFTVLILLTGCASTPESKDYTQFRTVNPRSILVVPVVNRSLEVEAPDYFLSTIPIPLAEQGYYVFPVHMVKRIMEDDGLSDADMVHGVATPRLCALFGSDVVLYVIIENWEAEYTIFVTRVKVEMTYTIKDCQTGDELWKDNEMMVYSSGGNSSGSGGLGSLIASMVNAAITKAAPNYMPLAHQANARAFTYPGPGIPPGPYLRKAGEETVTPKKVDDPSEFDDSTEPAKEKKPLPTPLEDI